MKLSLKLALILLNVLNFNTSTLKGAVPLAVGYYVPIYKDWIPSQDRYRYVGETFKVCPGGKEPFELGLTEYESFYEGNVEIQRSMIIYDCR